MNIPIIGQPEVTDCFITLQVKCTCGHSTLLAGAPGTMRPCGGKDCSNMFKIGTIPVIQRNRQIGGAPIIFYEDGTYSVGLDVGTISKTTPPPSL